MWLKNVKHKSPRLHNISTSTFVYCLININKSLGKSQRPCCSCFHFVFPRYFGLSWVSVMRALSAWMTAVGDRRQLSVSCLILPTLDKSNTFSSQSYFISYIRYLCLLFSFESTVFHCFSRFGVLENHKNRF